VGILIRMERAAPLDDEPIPFITLPTWVKAASRCGFNIEPVFTELGITTDLLNLETATIERPKLERAMERCVELSRDAHFPFVLGESFAFDYLPDLETFLATSPDLRSALRALDWVRELVNPMLDLRLRENTDTASVVLHFGVMETPPKPWFSETTFATVVKFGRRLLGEDRHLFGLRFRHSPPPYAAAYQAFFGLPVHFEATEHALDINRCALDEPLPGAYRDLHEQAGQRIERRLRALPRQQRLVTSVEQSFARRPALLGLGIQAMADELGLHPRTLQRRLAENHTHFADLQTHVRQRLARRYLDDPEVSVDHVSEWLGFSDRRSFTRAFSRWTGMTPSAYRRQR